MSNVVNDLSLVNTKLIVYNTHDNFIYMKNTPLVKPHPGYLFVKPYIETDGSFISAKETVGEDQRSVVLEIGDSVTDSQGILREANCKKGDIIIHASTNKTIQLDFTEYRFVHFSEIHGLWTP